MLPLLVPSPNDHTGQVSYMGGQKPSSMSHRPPTRVCIAGSWSPELGRVWNPGTRLWDVDSSSSIVAARLSACPWTAMGVLGRLCRGAPAPDAVCKTN